MPYNINDELEEAMKEFGNSGGGSSTFYKIQEGNQNVVRVLTEGKTYATLRMGQGEYRTLYGKEKGDPLRSRLDWDHNKTGRVLYPFSDREEETEARPSIRSVYYVIDRNDGKVKQAEFPYSVAKQLGELQNNPDYFFEEMPMPYDVRITYDKSKSPASMYKVDVKPNGAAPTKEQLEVLEKRMEKYSPEAVVEEKKKRQMEEDMKRGIYVDEDERASLEKEFNDGMKAQMAKQSSEEPVIQYPADEINPEDIPF